MSELLTDPQLRRICAELPSWTYDPTRKAFHRHIIFAEFTEALAAVVRIGVHAERMNHHPEWANVYNRLDIWLTTHDAGGVTMRDVALAQIVDQLIAK